MMTSCSLLIVTLLSFFLCYVSSYYKALWHYLSGYMETKPRSKKLFTQAFSNTRSSKYILILFTLMFPTFVLKLKELESDSGRAFVNAKMTSQECNNAFAVYKNCHTEYSLSEFLMEVCEQSAILTHLLSWLK